MRIAALTIAAVLSASATFAQEPAVDRTAIWLDTVKRGDLAIAVRGQGVLKDDRTAELRVPQSMMKQVRPGQAASIDTRQGVASGTVARIGSPAANGTVPVLVEIEGALPAAARPGTQVHGTIRIETLSDVAYVGRPVMCRPENEDTIFKLEPDGRHAARAKVFYGRVSVNQVEVRRGLEPGDKVILSDMSKYKAQSRVRLQ